MKQHQLFCWAFYLVMLVGCNTVIPPIDSGSIPKDGINLTIKADHMVYDINDPVTITIIINNTGQKGLFIDQYLILDGLFQIPKYANLAFFIRDSSGNLLPFTLGDFGKPIEQLSLPINKNDFAMIAPGEHIEDTISINHNYELRKPGKYSIQAIYKNDIEVGTDVETWTGSIFSNFINIQIK